jgi:hypothetical protein
MTCFTTTYGYPLIRPLSIPGSRDRENVGTLSKTIFRVKKYHKTLRTVSAHIVFTMTVHGKRKSIF